MVFRYLQLYPCPADCKQTHVHCWGDFVLEETVPEPNSDEVVVFEEFFTAGLRMPPHPLLAVILLKFQV
jgi:hypothetical protein